MKTIDTETAKVLHTKSPGVARTLAAEIRNALVPLNIAAYEGKDQDAQQAVERLKRIAHALFNGHFEVGDVVRFVSRGTIGIVLEVREDGMLVCDSAGQRVLVEPHRVDQLRRGAA